MNSTYLILLWRCLIYMCVLIWQAGQVYGVALSGSQLARSGIFPELRPCGEDFQKKWIEVYLVVVLLLLFSSLCNLLWHLTFVSKTILANLYKGSTGFWMASNIVVDGYILMWLAAWCEYGGICNSYKLIWPIYENFYMA